jgi:FkbM family methyltransferase
MKHLIAKLLRGTELLSVKNIFYYIKDYKNFSVSSVKLVNNIYAYVPNIKTIIDVGANRGQFLFAANKCFPAAQIYSFEPLPSLFSALKEGSKDLTNISVNNLALSKSEGEISFYESEYSHISSALKISENNDNPKYFDAKVKEIKVNTTTLNNFFDGKKVQQPTLLKIDAQGLEKEILEGAEDFLEQINFIALELAFTKLYEEQPLFSEIHEYLISKGYTFLAPLDFHTGADNKIIEIDALYVKN